MNALVAELDKKFSRRFAAVQAAQELAGPSGHDFQGGGPPKGNGNGIDATSKAAKKRAKGQSQS